LCPFREEPSSAMALALHFLVIHALLTCQPPFTVRSLQPYAKEEEEEEE